MQSTSLAGRSILIVEDEPLIALDIVTAFEKVGALTLIARTLAEAARLVEHDDLSAAVLDFGLGEDDAGAVYGRLQERAIPFVLHSGYKHASDACRGGTVVPKPARPEALIRAVEMLLSQYAQKTSRQA
jgi:DNA-binding response OmpR family regulator